MVATSVYDTLVWASLRERGIPEKDTSKKVLFVTHSHDPRFEEQPKVKVLINDGYEVTQVANTRESVASLVHRVGRVEEYFGRTIFDGQGEPYEGMKEVFLDYVWEAMQK